MVREYLNLLEDVLQHGAQKSDRTGTGTLSVFGRQARFDLSQSFPLLTTKKVHWKSVVHELLWFLRGETNVRYLQEKGVSIWDEWADENGDLGPVYGRQWRAWPSENGGIDQIAEALKSIAADPHSRRHIVASWNVAQLPQMRIPPCHIVFQFYVADGALSCQLYQRSADIFLGVPFNIASYALLTLMTAQVCGLRPGEFVHTFGDLHLYVNHIKQAETQLARTPLPPPQVRIAPRESIFDFVFDDIALLNYAPHPPISAPVAV